MRLVVLSALLLVSFTALSIINYRTVADSIHDEIVSSSLPLLQENLYTEILTDLSPALSTASMMASDSFLMRWTEEGETEPQRVVEYLDAIHRQYGYFSVFFVSNTTGNYYHQSGITKQISPADDHDDWYYDFVASDEQYVLDVDTNEAANNRLTIFINYRLESFEGDLLGVTGVGLEMDGFAQFLRNTQEKYNRTIYLADRTGMIQAHPNTERVQTWSVAEDPALQAISDQILTPSETPTDAELVRDGDTYLISSRYMPELEWFLLVEQNETLSLRSARENLFRTILVGLLVSVAIITLSALTMRRFDLRMEELAATDALTGLANRRAFDRRLAEAESRSSRYGTPFSLIVFDVDRFKTINDTHGHQVGDRVLQRLSAVVSDTIRPTDVLARWGGDEFAILVEGSLDEAEQAAKRIRDRLAQTEPPEERATVSVGIAERQADEPVELLLRRADQALYRAKEAGRDRIWCATAPDPQGTKSTT